MIDRLAVFVLTYHNHTQEQLERCLWSIEQQDAGMDFEPIIVVNSTDETYFPKVQEWFGDNYSVVETESDGYTGKGTNSVLEYYRKSLISEFSHMCIIDGDDYYYPMAFGLIDQIHEKSNFDFLSGMAHHVDSIRPQPPNDGRPVVPYKDDRWVWSFLDNRVSVHPYMFWDSQRIPGGEVTLCHSNKAAENETLRCLEGANRVDDYFFLLTALIAHINRDLVFVSTDCNDIYIYDCTGESITQGKQDDFDPTLGWPYDKNGLVLSEVKKAEYEVLEGITRQHLPYVTMPQVWGGEQKAEYLKENDLS